MEDVSPEIAVCYCPEQYPDTVRLKVYPKAMRGSFLTGR